jgi:hypothetical protein
MNPAARSRRRTVVLWLLLFGFVVSIPLASAVGYFIYRKLTYSLEFGEKFGTFDDELGWVLRENATSYIRGRSLLKREVYYDSKVFTNALGFRDRATALTPQPEGIVTIGDSWTFGYCVDFEETYPFYLESLLKLPVSNLGIPAYGSGATYGLFRRHVERLRPKLVVYLALGLADRSIEIERPETSVLIPTFYYDSTTREVGLLFPEPGAVTRSVAQGIYPGGSLTAGYDTWSYLRYIKLPEIMNTASAFYHRGLSTVVRQPAPNLDARRARWAERAKRVDAILGYEMGLYAALMEKHRFAMVVIDGTGRYNGPITRVNQAHAAKITVIPKGEYEARVYRRAEELRMSDHEKRVPMDGHFGRGTNRLIAELVAAAADPAIGKDPEPDPARGKKQLATGAKLMN